MGIEIWMILFVVGLFLLGSDFVVPSGGILGITGTVLMVAAVVQSFRLGYPGFGVGLIVFGLIAVPIIVILGLKRLTLKTALSGRETTLKAMEDTSLLGETGVALTMLRPSGTAEIRDRRRDVVTDGVLGLQDRQ